MLIKRSDDIKPSDITDEKIYHQRRAFLQAGSRAALAVAAGAVVPGMMFPGEAAFPPTKKSIH